MPHRIHNFSPGPGVLPLPVLEQAQAELLDYAGSGMSVMELSHRSNLFESILAKAEAGLRRVMAIPEDYAVLFLQGGASLQFAMVPMNLYREGQPVDVLHTGAWTEKAIAELEKVATYRLAASVEADRFSRLPRPAELDLNPDASYVHLCSNNTIFGTQWQTFPDPGPAPLVADMSSDILSRAVDVSRFGLIFAGAQKNIGIAGTTLVILRPELAERAGQALPAMLQYRTHIKGNSLYNTPPTFGVYMTGLVLDWIEAQGGVAAMEQQNEAKAALLYGIVDNSDFYRCPVAPEDRSRMNLIIRIRDGDEALEKKFVTEAGAAGLAELKGHRSVGGLRVSLYNAQTLAAVQALADFMQTFAAKYG